MVAVITLCGSTKFKNTHLAEMARLTLEGNIVIPCGLYGHADGHGLTEDQKLALDELHLRKIDISDRIHVINVSGYIGESTSNEIAYARANGKEITYYDD